MITEQIERPIINFDSNRNIVTDINILSNLNKIHCKEEDFISKVRDVFSHSTPAKLWFKWNEDYKINNPFYHFPKDGLLYQDNKYIDVPYNFSVTPITEPIRCYYRLDVLFQDGYVKVLESWIEEV